jgi:hypothetical protein
MSSRSRPTASASGLDREITLKNASDEPSLLVLGTVERFRSLGHRATRDHVQLFGRVPHIAPRAWLHAVPPGLNDAELADLVRRVGRPFRPEYLKFLRAMNGVKLFCGALCLYGARPAMAGRGIDAAFLPFDLVDPNGVERPTRLEEQLLVIGGYREDGSLITLDFASGEVSRCSRETEARFLAWPSFGDFVREELARLDRIHDEQGRAIAPREVLSSAAKRAL